MSNGPDPARRLLALVFKYGVPVLLGVTGVLLVVVSVNLMLARRELAQADERAVLHLSWYEKERGKPKATCAPCSECEVCAACAEAVACPEYPVCANGIAPVNAVCVEATFEKGDTRAYEIALAFHDSSGNWSNRVVMTSGGLLPPELGLMGLTEANWKLLRAGQALPCPMSLAPCSWDETRRLEGPSGTMTSLWTADRTDDHIVLGALACTNVNLE